MSVIDFKQYCTFYDTTGIIDRGKRLYYVPSESSLVGATGTTVAQRYVNLFDTVCPPPLSAYTNIEISRWNPEDRELLVDGNIDTFRKGSNSHPLSYLIIKRVHQNSMTPTLHLPMFYGFFIEKAYQAGINSVRLELVPDLFTNVFYLSNNLHQPHLSSYDPFNRLIKNAYVERQHYDRFEYLPSEETISTLNLPLFATTKETYNYRLQYKSKRLPVSIYKMNGTSYFKILSKQNLEYYDTNAKIKNAFNNSPSVVMPYAYASINYLHILTKERITYPSVTKIDNLQPKEYVQAHYSSDYEVGENIPSAQQHLVIPFFTNNKDLKHFVDYFKQTGIQFVSRLLPEIAQDIVLDTLSDGDMSNLIARLEDVFGYYIESIYVTPYSELSNNMSVILSNSGEYQIQFMGNIYNAGMTQSSTITTSPLAEFLGIPRVQNVSQSLDMYDSRVITEPTYVFIPLSKPETEFPQSSFNTGNQTLDAIMSSMLYYFNTWARKSISTNESFKEPPIPLFKADSAGSQPLNLINLAKNSDSEGVVYDRLILAPAFLVGKKSNLESTFTITKEVTNVGSQFDSYYEPILEAEPYSLYTLSFLEVESPISMKRLYLNTGGNGSGWDGYDITDYFNCKITFNQLVNAQYKFALIPSYQVYNSGYMRYYNESLLYVSSDGITIRNNSFYDYTYQQGARMATERYLQSLNGAIDIGKYVVNDIPFNIGSGMMQGGWKGAVVGAGRSLRDVSNMAVDYVKDINSMRHLQEADLAGAGARADTYSSVGTELYYDLNNSEYMIYYNEYKIDDVSYNSIAKTLERYGYKVDIYDTLNVYNRQGWNFIKLYTFDYVENTAIRMTTEQEDELRNILIDGVTLLHNPEWLANGYHNIEKCLEEAH